MPQVKGGQGWKYRWGGRKENNKKKSPNKGQGGGELIIKKAKKKNTPLYNTNLTSITKGETPHAPFFQIF